MIICHKRQGMRGWFMKKWIVILVGAILALICTICINLAGDTLVLKTYIPVEEIENVLIETDYGDDIVKVVGTGSDDGFLTIKIASVSMGREYIAVLDGDDMIGFYPVHVHDSGVITEDTYFGRCTGAWIIPATTIVFLIFLILSLALAYRSDLKKNPYQYRNVSELGLIVYLSFLLIDQLLKCLGFQSLENSIRHILISSQNFATIALPAAFVLSIAVSNINLMRKEGRTWRNMLGCILGVFICLGTLFPMLLGEWLQRTSLVNVHNEGGVALYVEMFVEAAAGSVIAYLECVLIGTVILGIKAARHIPSFDKDYIIIHGCQIKKDGTLTNLLKGRADRAVEFAKMQKDATGKDIIFIPSGGKGNDEIISEAEAISNYLKSTGIPEDRIIPEDASVNTLDNLRKASSIIEKRGGGKVAFSTTNYHVFRTGLLATELSLCYEGIGSPTKSYFWINAFVREFIATLHSERKTHLTAIVIIIAMILIMTCMVYMSVNITRL